MVDKLIYMSTHPVTDSEGKAKISHLWLKMADDELSWQDYQYCSEWKDMS